MQGRIIRFDYESQEGLIECDLGNIYKFNAYNYHDLPNIIGEKVLFQVSRNLSDIHSIYIILSSRFIKVENDKNPNQIKTVNKIDC